MGKSDWPATVFWVVVGVVGLWVLSILVLIGLLSCSSVAYAGTSQQLRIAFLGDSITTGYYPEELRKLLGHGTEIRVYARKSHGVSGINEEMWGALQDDFYPTHIVLYAGINDCSAQRYRNIKQREEDVVYVTNALDAMISHIQANSDAQVIVIKHHPWLKYSEFGWECSLGVNRWLDMEPYMAESVFVIDTFLLGYDNWPCCYTEWNEQWVSESVKIPIGWDVVCPEDREKECERWFQLRDEYNAGDGLHLNYEGHKRLAQLIYDQVDWCAD